VELRWVTEADVATITAASHLFDYQVRPEWAQRFVDQAGHHLCLAHADGDVAGFVSGIEVTHPDKGTEMFLYELAVAERFRGRGIGTALVLALVELATTSGCYGMWVLTDQDNSIARATYTSAGAIDQSNSVMLTWRLDNDHQTFTDPPP
jgi:ribosomal protein S18 acetylase RimI-like enzyme